MDLAPSEALDRVRTWERKNCKLTCLILFPPSDMSIAFTGRVSEREGRIVLTGYGGCGLYFIPVESVTFSYCNAFLSISGTGWRCVLWERND